MEWKFDEYDKSYACLESQNHEVRFVIRHDIRDPETSEVVLYYTPYQYRKIKNCYSKEEAMSFVEDLITNIRTMK